MALITRRGALAGAMTGGGLLMAGCSRVLQTDALMATKPLQAVFGVSEAWTYATQKFLLSGGELAREYKPSEISKIFFANGTTNPATADYDQAAADRFANWRFTITGRVARPMSLSLAQLRALPARTQITRHDCVEGWSAIGQWTGVPVGLLLKAAGAMPGAKYVIFHCADNLDGEPSKGGQQAPGQYYESLAMASATHPQTLIAYAMNGAPLAVAHGAPLRLRVERQLGYKQAKYLQGMEVADSFTGLAGGKGGYWEDRGYDWWAGM